MAFNPFHGFRKHQKTFFAGLTILCMVVFVLGGFSGSFRELGSFFKGGGSRGGTEVANLYGQPITAPDLSEVRAQREIADQFMRNALYLTTEATASQVMEGLKTADIAEQDKNQLTQFLMFRSFLFQDANFLRQQLPQIFQHLARTRNSLEMAKKQLAGNSEALAKKQKAVELVQQVEGLFQQELALFSLGRNLYFGGDLTPEGLLDFLIWRHEADRLGIHFTGKEVGQLIKQETGNMLPPQGFARANDAVRQNRRSLTSAQLANSVADEFRVRMAQRALLGAEARAYTREPSALTPYELWDFFQKQRAESRIAMLPIPVEQKAFLDQVKDPPAEELKNFFDQNKYRLYNPSSEIAGFKQPARVAVEWVRAKPDAPVYQKATEIVEGLTQATLPVAATLNLVNEYENAKFLHPAPSWVKDQFQLQLHDSSIDRPANVAAAVGQALAASGMAGPAVLSGYTAYKGTAAYHEVAGRVRAGTSMLLSGAGGSALTTLATVIAGEPTSPYLSLDRVKPFLTENMSDRVNRDLVAKSLKTLEDDLRTLSNLKTSDRLKNSYVTSLLGQALASVSPVGLEGMAQAVYERGQDTLLQRDLDPMAAAFTFVATSGPAPWIAASLVYREDTLPAVEAKQRVAAAIEKFGWEHGSSREPRDSYHIGDDPGLDSMRKAFEGPWGETHRSATNTKLFANEVYNNVKPGNAYAPHRLMASNEFLYWKTGERAEYVPTFTEAEAQVKARWQFEKARALAKEEAERVAKKISANATGGDAEMTLRDASPKLGGKVFELDHVARLVQGQQEFMPTQAPPRGYNRYQVPQSKIEYSSAALTNKLLEMDKEGAAVVVHDRPEATYYVAVLVSKSTPYELTFLSEARNPDDLLTWYDRDTKAREEARKSFVKQLEAQARLTIDKKALKGLDRSSDSLEE